MVASVMARNPRRFKWDNATEQRTRRGIRASERSTGFRIAVYRPFFRQHLYFDRVLNTAVSQLPRIFPTAGTRNPCILVERGLRAPGRAPAVLAIDAVPDIAAGAGASGLACQVLPRYTYGAPQEGRTQGALLLPDHRRRDNITVAALAAYRAR